LDPDGSSLLFLIAIHWGLVGGLVLLGILLLLSAMISGSEVAFFSLDSNQLKQIENDPSASANRILALREKPRRLLATILISNYLANVGIVILAYSIFKTILPPTTLHMWGVNAHAAPLFNWLNAEQWASFFRFMITIAGVTFMLVLFGEVIPKIYANINNLTFARRMSTPLTVLMAVFAPITKIMVKWGQTLEKKLNAENTLGATKVDIDKAIDLAVAHDKDSAMEAEILKSIVSFNDVAVKQIMRSRMDIVALDTLMTHDEMLQTVKEAGYSRLPVYEEQLDSIKGILYVKDLIGFLENNHDEQPWQTLVRPEILYVPEARKINELLKDFQREHLHMAIVVDEYGGTSGIVTMEDVIEEVIGEIKDEFDEDQELEYRRLSDTEYIFEGRTMLIDVCRIMNIDKTSFEKSDGDADSLAGLVLDINGKMPVVGQTLSLPPFTFTVLSVSAKRIERIKVQIDT
jgi:gliding motility-associated protein GldE